MAKQNKKTPAPSNNNGGSSLSTKAAKSATPALPSEPVEYDGKKYLPLVHAINHEGTVYSAEEFLENADVMKFLVENTFNKAGVSRYLKECF